VATEYAIAGGLAGKERLDVLQRVHGPFTSALLDRVGISRGARCLDAGCGGGHVSRELAARVGETGAVVGIDLDEVVLDLARSDALAAGITNVEFRAGDATDLDVSDFDVVFARFLLSHGGTSVVSRPGLYWLSPSSTRSTSSWTSAWTRRAPISPGVVVGNAARWCGTCFRFDASARCWIRATGPASRKWGTVGGIDVVSGAAARDA